ncbi:MAG: hypothetical protein ABIN97_06470, partial [Ginsengibacter sp.]
AVELGFEKLLLKDETLKCFFVGNPESKYFQSKTFSGILKYIQTQTNKARLKQSGKNGILIVEKIKSMGEVWKFLKKMEESID